MWQAIQYVTGGFTLCAFIAAIIAYAYTKNIEDRRRRIELAPAEDRARLVSKTLEFFDIDTSSMSEKMQYDLAIAQVKARIERFRLGAAIVLVVAVLGAGLTAYSIWRKPNGTTPLQSQPEHKAIEAPDTSTRSTGLSGASDWAVAGVVVDSKTNASLPLAEVTISGRSEHDTTDDNGNFRIELSANPPISKTLRVQVTKAGYKASDKSVTVPVNDLYVLLEKD
jgi:hypothetical protein